MLTAPSGLFHGETLRRRETAVCTFREYIAKHAIYIQAAFVHAYPGTRTYSAAHPFDIHNHNSQGGYLLPAFERMNATPFSDLHLLLIDDNTADRFLFRTAMAEIQCTYRITEAENGRQGLEKAREVKPSLIVVDINMPVMTGIEFMAEISRDEELKHIPVFVWTSSTRPEEMQIVRDHGVIDIIYKAYSYADLLKQISAMCAFLEYKIKGS
jgi:CheY-like chemotaxis protein